MSIWSKIIETIGNNDGRKSTNPQEEEVSRDSSRFAFVDVEVGIKDKKIHDIGAWRWDDAIFHSADKRALQNFMNGIDYVCGHNIIHHDAKYLYGEEKQNFTLVDTLYVSPLLFPEKPYHRLLKNDKLVNDHMNNPVNDCKKSYELLMDEVAKWDTLSASKQTIYSTLLNDIPEFDGFLRFVNAHANKSEGLEHLIRNEYKQKVCENADIKNIIAKQPVELAYALALIDTTDHRSITPAWVLHNYPNVENVITLLRHKK